MKSSLEKLGRKLSKNRGDVKEMRDHQPSALIDELAQASKDMQDMRNCYDGLLSAAAATANSIYEFSESLNEMGNCLLGKTAVNADSESGKVLSTLGNMQLELQKIADTYRSYVIVTITNPSESLLTELKKVEEMKLQCDEKREVYEYMMAQHKEKGKLRNSIAQKLREAQDEYDEVTRLCIFRVKSLKEGQWRSLLTQAARHHAAQLSFFRKGLKAVEAVEPFIRNVAEKHRIDCQLSGLYDGSHEGDPTSGYESADDGELSFDSKQKKQGLDDDGTSANPMEPNHVDALYFQASNTEDSDPNLNRHKGDQLVARQRRVASYSAPLYPDACNTSEKLREAQPTQKFYSYVLPPPITDTRNPASKPPASVSPSTPFQYLQHDNISTSTLTSKVQSGIKDGKSISSSTQLPPPSTGRFSFSQRDKYNRSNSIETAKRQSYSGPLPPSKQFSFKFASNNSGPITSSELPQPRSRVPFSQPNLQCSASPPPLSSPKISELHELPRPPPSNNLALSKPVAISGGFIGHSAPLLLKGQEICPPNNRAMLSSTLPLPPSVVKINSE
ncbi:hypothetical protein SSX86_028916 [Deinandra increscens subsp. villosa]|uniref:BAR domain-containing protein n=1 Tax=Deinandra increscens subsp. villosa TaxID=3103831 RepID=A0AAP0GKX8_9ASTR